MFLVDSGRLWLVLVGSRAFWWVLVGSGVFVGLWFWFLVRSGGFWLVSGATGIVFV
jgi:hypothetical protein